MNFDDRLWDGSDPTYSPCTGPSSGLLYWKAPAKYRKAGYAITTQRLPGRPGDGKDLDRAALARDLTRSMVRWFEGEASKVEPVNRGGAVGVVVASVILVLASAVTDVVMVAL